MSKKPSASPAQIYVLAALAAILVAAASYFFVIQPEYEKYSSVNADIADTNFAISNNRSTLADLENKRDNLPTVIGSTEAFAANFPNDASQSQLLTDLTTIAAANDATVSGITAATPYRGTVENGTGSAAALDAVNSGLVSDDASTIAMVSVTVNVKGSYDSVTGFVRGLEERPEWVSVLRVNYSTSGEDTVAAISIVQYLSTPLGNPAG